MALADEFDGFLVDLDGVVWIGREPVPGSAEALATLLAARQGDRLRHQQPRADRRRPTPSGCGGMGVEVEAERIVTAGMATTALAAERVGRGAGAFVIGAEAFKGAAADAGARRPRGRGRGAAATRSLVSGHRGFDYEELLTATLALQGGAALVATSRDPTMPMPGGDWPGTGAILAAVETATGAGAEIGGKPERHLFDLARERIGRGAGRVAMVGDRHRLRHRGRPAAGLDDDPRPQRRRDPRRTPKPPSTPPDHVVDDLAALLR